MSDNKKTKADIEGRINACQQELRAYDYAARKVAFEAARVIKAFHPEIELPMLEKYAEIEAVADERRAEIRALEAELEDAEDERI